MKKILVISFSDLRHDARVARQIEFIKDQYEVTAICYQGKQNHGYQIIPIQKTRFTLPHKLFSSFFLLTRLFKKAYSLLYQVERIIEKLKSSSYDLIIANDVESLPLAFSLKGSAKIVFDAHEYAPRHFEDRLMWRIFFQPLNVHLCKKYISLVDAMTTVGKGLATEYHKNFGVSPQIITNATWHSAIRPTQNKSGKIRLIHHGGSTPSRKLELMIEMMTHLDDRFTLDLMLIVPQLASAQTANYINYLKGLSANDKRIQFLPPLKSEELVAFLNQYDVGVFLLPPINFNYANTLPNKLFDFIQARLAIAIGPTPEMEEIVNHYDIGVVSDDFTPKKLAEKLQLLTTEDIGLYKNKTEAAALDLTAEKNKEKLLSIISELL